MTNLFNPEKICHGTLVGCDGNAFYLMAHFTSCAKKSGWSKGDIDLVIKTAMAGNYDNLIVVLTDHMDNDK